MLVSSDGIDGEDIDSEVKAVFTEIIVLSRESDNDGSCVLKDPVFEVIAVLIDGKEVGKLALVLGRLIGNEEGLLKLRPIFREMDVLGIDSGVEVLGINSEIEELGIEGDIEVLGSETDTEVGKSIVLIEVETEGSVSEGVLKDKGVDGKFVGRDKLVDGRLMLRTKRSEASSSAVTSSWKAG